MNSQPPLPLQTQLLLRYDEDDYFNHFGDEDGDGEGLKEDDRFKFNFSLEKNMSWLFLYKIIWRQNERRKALQIDIKSFSSEFMFVKKAVAGKYESFSCYISITLP